MLPLCDAMPPLWDGSLATRASSRSDSASRTLSGSSMSRSGGWRQERRDDGNDLRAQIDIELLVARAVGCSDEVLEPRRWRDHHHDLGRGRELECGEHARRWIADRHDQRATGRATDRQRTRCATELGGDHRGDGRGSRFARCFCERTRHAELIAESARAVVELDRGPRDQSEHKRRPLRVCSSSASLSSLGRNTRRLQQQLTDPHVAQSTKDRSMGVGSVPSNLLRRV